MALQTSSLPTRERELKLAIRLTLSLPVLSLPTRERELKQCARPFRDRQPGRSLHGSVN